jgi:Anaphase promoting complex subunit 8 / Cdc23
MLLPIHPKEVLSQHRNGTGTFILRYEIRRLTKSVRHRAAEMLTGLKPSLKTAAAAQNLARRPPPHPEALYTRPKSPPPLPPAPRFVNPGSSPTALVSRAQLQDGGVQTDLVATFERLEGDGLKIPTLSVPVSQEEKDAYSIARRFFDAKEFERVVFTLHNCTSAQSRFLSYYSQYLVCYQFLAPGQLTLFG